MRYPLTSSMNAGDATGFGQQQQQQQQQQPAGRGTRVAPWSKTMEKEGTAGNQQNVSFMTIACMPQYRGKSTEELRWEDYQVKHQPDIDLGPEQSWETRLLH